MVDGQVTPTRPITWLAVVVGVTGAVVPLGAVGTTGVGSDQAIGVAVEGDPEDVGAAEDDELPVVGIGEPAPVGVADNDFEETALVVAVDPAPLAVVVGEDPKPLAPCPEAGTVLEVSREGLPEPPPTERTKPVTNATIAKLPAATALRHLARRDKRIDWPP